MQPTSTVPPLKFYTLLHFADRQENAANLASSGKRKLYQILARNVVTLNLSLELLGFKLNVVTNDVPRLQQLFGSLGTHGNTPNIVLGNFDLVPPAGICFYSSHCKLNLFRMFAEKPDEISILLDCDILALRPLPDWMIEAAKTGSVICYNIMDQVAPSLGSERLRQDLRILDPAISPKRWVGGEMICAQGKVFAQLNKAVMDLWPHYCAQPSSFYHDGEELLVTAVVHGLERRGVQVVDAGSAGIIRRFWSVRTLHAQASIKDSESLCLLHLPADKEFLARIRRKDLLNDARRFWQSYHVYWRYRRIMSEIKSALAKLLAR